MIIICSLLLVEMFTNMWNSYMVIPNTYSDYYNCITYILWVLEVLSMRSNFFKPSSSRYPRKKILSRPKKKIRVLFNFFSSVEFFNWSLYWILIDFCLAFKHLINPSDFNLAVLWYFLSECFLKSSKASYLTKGVSFHMSSFLPRIPPSTKEYTTKYSLILIWIFAYQFYLSNYLIRKLLLYDHYKL